MSRNVIFPAIAIGILLILACVVPPGVAPQPLSTTDPNALSTFVAGTAAVLATRTAIEAQALNTPTETPYAIPSRPASGSVLSIQPDGSTYFADALTGIEIVIPNGWMALRINEQEYYRAWADETSLRLGFTHILTNFSGQDPNIVRLIVLDIQDGHSQNLFPANIIIQTGHPYTLEEAVKVQLEHHRSIYSDLEVVFQNPGEIKPGVPAITLAMTYRGISITTGKEIKVYEKFILFNNNGKVTSIKFETLDELQTTLYPHFEQILSSLALFAP